MIAELLQQTGIRFRHSRFLKPPQSTYAVWDDDIETDGADNSPAAVFTHNYTVELYEPAPDDAAEQALEAALDAACILYRREDRYWMQDEQRYQVVYEFSVTTKERES
jgi:hypothetical protein